MSGFYEMKPVRLSNRSSYVKFTDEMGVAMSTHALGQKRTFRHSLDHFIGALPFQRLDACWMFLGRSRHAFSPKSSRTEIAEDGLLPPGAMYRVKNCHVERFSKRTISG